MPAVRPRSALGIFTTAAMDLANRTASACFAVTDCNCNVAVGFQRSPLLVNESLDQVGDSLLSGRGGIELSADFAKPSVHVLSEVDKLLTDGVEAGLGA